MKILVAYIAVSRGPITHDYCARFVGSYLQNKPDWEHETVVVCNGGPLPMETAIMFEPLGAKYFPRENDPGWDISAYQDVASKIPCDMLVCFGESVHFHHPGWLRKLAEAWLRFGPGMYGLFSSFLIRAHMNTTAFVCDPKLILQYPKPNGKTDRYEFEHGAHAFWKYVQAQGKPTKLVTWDGNWDPLFWRSPKNILWRGTQRNCLAFCSHTDRYFAANPTTKRRWERWIDGPFK